MIQPDDPRVALEALVEKVLALESWETDQSDMGNYVVHKPKASLEK